jgi:chromosomal replication initiator protein
MKGVAIADCRRAVQVWYRMPKHEMLSPRLFRRMSRPRMIAMCLAREFTGGSMPVIARVFKRGHHTTVLHAVRRVAEWEQSNPVLREDLFQLRLTLAVYAAQKGVEP